MNLANSVVDHFPIVHTAQGFSRRSILPTGNLARLVLLVSINRASVVQTNA
jgi:hypothetical protein